MLRTCGAEGSLGVLVGVLECLGGTYGDDLEEVCWGGPVLGAKSSFTVALMGPPQNGVAFLPQSLK